jgi:hypothetical protein
MREFQRVVVLARQAPGTWLAAKRRGISGSRVRASCFETAMRRIRHPEGRLLNNVDKEQQALFREGR